MNKFKKGDRVVCVDASGLRRLKKGKKYTVIYVDRKFLLLDEHITHYSASRFELAKPTMKVGDMVEVSNCKNFSNGYERELLADLSGNGIENSFVCRHPESSRYTYHWKYARPIQEPTIELTVNGNPVEISEETLAAIKEAIQ